MTKQKSGKFGFVTMKVRGLDKRLNTLDGIPIKNATKSVQLHITDTDIKGSRSKAPDKCVAAKACLRQLNAVEARVHLGKTYVRSNGKWVRYTTSVALQKEIISFDRGGSFEPGTYTLYKIQPSHATGEKMSKDTPRRRNKNNKTKNRYAFVTNVRSDVVHAD